MEPKIERVIKRDGTQEKFQFRKNFFCNSKGE